ncbi:cation:proton antiporter [bacterium]|nr:cation:proton antiporter [bacterium]
MDLNAAITIALGLTGVGLVAACIRMFLGPTAADRIVSLDLVTVLLVAITSLLALRLDNSAYLDLGLALALVGFLATVAFARYLETNEQVRIDDTIPMALPVDKDPIANEERPS